MVVSLSKKFMYHGFFSMIPSGMSCPVMHVGRSITKYTHTTHKREFIVD
jgi:hypothetical protein